MIYAERAVEMRRRQMNIISKKAVNGVKGPSALSMIMPDYIRGTGLDSMHLVYEGVTKKLLYLWFDASLSDKPFSLRQMIGVIDNMLLNIKPPKFIHRMPSSVKLYSNWKASELKTWLLYYSPPVLHHVMRPDLFNHYMLLVSAIGILNKDVISSDNIGFCRRLLHEFVKQFETIYGLRYCSINIHLLLHLPDDVELFGPLWVNSCFSFENINGHLIKNVHGTSNLDSQISKYHLQLLRFASRTSNIRDGPIKNFILH